MTEKKENFGCLSKSLEKFLQMKEEKRRKKFGNDVNKYYQRIVNNVNFAISDIIMAYENLPQDQRKKIDLLTQVDILVGYVMKKKLEGSPKKMILNTKNGLNAIRSLHIRNTSLEKLADGDFERVSNWLEYLTPKNPNEKGFPI